MLYCQSQTLHTPLRDCVQKLTFGSMHKFTLLAPALRQYLGCPLTITNSTQPLWPGKGCEKETENYSLSMSMGLNRGMLFAKDQFQCFGIHTEVLFELNICLK